MPNWRKLVVSGSDANLSNLNVDSAVTASYFKGDGSALTNITSTVVETATVTDSFTSQTSVAVSHNFGTRNILVSVYDNIFNQIIPASVVLTNTNTVTIGFDNPTSGTVVVAKGGHIVSGSSSVDITTQDITDLGSLSISGSILPTLNNQFDLGSPSKTWRDLYLSSASLYIDGTQVISSTSDVLTFTTDVGQSIKLLETGGDDIILQTDTGNIELKGTIEVLSGKKIIDSAGNKVLIGNTVGITGSLETTGNINGIDLNAFSSSVATSLNNTASDWDSVTNKPTGLVSSSNQITALTSYTEPFTSQTAVTASHNLGTKNVTVSIYGSDDYMIFPTSIKTHDTNNVYVSFNSSRTGRIVITK